MDCRTAEEMLPWLLNGSLTPERRQELEDHLTHCTECRQAWQETKAAWAVYGQHLPKQELIEIAEGRKASRDLGEAARQHLASCPECSELLGLLQQGWRDLNPDTSSRPRPGRWTWLRPVPLAAGALLLLAALSLGVLWRQSTILEEDLRVLSQRNEQLEKERLQSSQQLDDYESQLADLSANLRDLSSPRVNVLAADAMPRRFAVRSGTGDVQPLQVPAGQTLLLILNSDRQHALADYEIEILDSRQASVWQASDVRRNPTGDFTLLVPSGFLASGNYRILVRSKARPSDPEQYDLLVSSP